MASITSDQLSSRVGSAKRDSRVATEFKAFWRQFLLRAFDPYRPELHYMRGRGPAWRAKHGAVSPAVQSMLTAKAARSPPGS
jgi:hypothetical protein